MTAACPMCNEPLPARPWECTCGHHVAAHDIAKTGRRTACSHQSGPKGTPCGCLEYVAAE